MSVLCDRIWSSASRLEVRSSNMDSGVHSLQAGPARTPY
jgi:hypothetical protein